MEHDLQQHGETRPVLFNVGSLRPFAEQVPESVVANVQSFAVSRVLLMRYAFDILLVYATLWGLVLYSAAPV